MITIEQFLAQFENDPEFRNEVLDYLLAGRGVDDIKEATIDD